VSLAASLSSRQGLEIRTTGTGTPRTRSVEPFSSRKIAWFSLSPMLVVGCLSHVADGWLSSSESAACSNQMWASIRANTAKQTAEQLIRPSRWTRPRGLELGSSTTGSKNVSSGSGGYTVPTAGSGGSGLVTFDPERALGAGSTECMQAFPTTPTARLAMRLS